MGPEGEGPAEQARLAEARRGERPWKKWGPYLGERQWGTVRENVRAGVDAWSDVTHDEARSRAYRSGEDGLAGFSDDRLLLCFALALWNERDPILKERLFGLTNCEGNHGEDVKEYYFYLDSLPTHAYAKLLYKYPQARFPYDDLVAENRRRSRCELEFELLDTRVFDEDRYWDVFVEYAKADPEDIAVLITAVNRGPDPAPLHVIPHLWFRNTWSHAPVPRPLLDAERGAGPQPGAAAHHQRIRARHPELGVRHLFCEGACELLFTENETNSYRLWGQPNRTPFQKDGINDYIVGRRPGAVNPGRVGTKAAARYAKMTAPGESWSVRLRLTPGGAGEVDPFGPAFDELFARRRREADEFYRALTPPNLSADAASVLRQGAAGMLWSKQVYVHDVELWTSDQGQTLAAPGPTRRWRHLVGADLIATPDKWEYPWFAGWNLPFHAVALASVDPDFADEQLRLMLVERYLHPNGQIPASEWNFDALNPPVHAWACLVNHRMGAGRSRQEGQSLLRRCFHLLLANFTWWMDRRDREGRDVFEGGLVGLDNLGLFDRGATAPSGQVVEQADGAGWMAFFAVNMLEMALELSVDDPVYEDLAVKFYDHVIRLTAAFTGSADENGGGSWDEEDGFFYDVLRVPGQPARRLKIRSMTGLLPLCAVGVFDPSTGLLPDLLSRMRWFERQRPDLLQRVHPMGIPGQGGRLMLSLLNEERLRRVLSRLLDPDEFLGPHGIRSVSRHHLQHPSDFEAGGRQLSIGYLAAEANTTTFGGNSNWRGPVWAPMNAILIHALLQMYAYHGDSFRIECPTGSGQRLTLFEVAREISNRMSAIFLRDVQGRRPVYGGTRKFQEDPHWRDLVLFYEYFHGDNGAGLGASHQTGWTALIPVLMQFFARTSPEDFLRTRERPAPPAADWPPADPVSQPR